MRDIFESFEFHTQIDRLAKADPLYLVTEKFLRSSTCTRARSRTRRWGRFFEELIRKFAELSNETAGSILRRSHRVHGQPALHRRRRAHQARGRPLDLRPNRGHGGCFPPRRPSGGDEPRGRVSSYAGRSSTPESYAICKADMLIKGQDISNIISNKLTDDGLPAHKFDYMLSNPPFGVEWKKVQKAVAKEHEQKATSAPSSVD
ncbi:MAG: N-6 DNA methylase [Phycisphaerales bacterium]